jgi:hypothetical protein
VDEVWIGSRMLEHLQRVATIYWTLTERDYNLFNTYRTWLQFIEHLQSVATVYWTLTERGYSLLNTYRAWLQFIEHLQNVTTSNYGAIANSHNLQFTPARTESPQSASVLMFITNFLPLCLMSQDSVQLSNNSKLQLLLVIYPW